MPGKVSNNGGKLEKDLSPSDNSDVAFETKEERETASSSSNTRLDGKIEIKEEDNHGKLGLAFPTWKKWTILTVIFAVQVSMNFNTSVYPACAPVL